MRTFRRFTEGYNLNCTCKTALPAPVTTSVQSPLQRTAVTLPAVKKVRTFSSFARKATKPPLTLAQRQSAVKPIPAAKTITH
jgi:hypothetical protein